MGPVSKYAGCILPEWCEGPAFTKGIECDTQVRDEGKDQNYHQKNNYPLTQGEIFFLSIFE